MLRLAAFAFLFFSYAPLACLIEPKQLTSLPQQSPHKAATLCSLSTPANESERRSKRGLAFEKIPDSQQLYHP
ncbi:hypothetical protein BC826DRAFT_57309 [Russula brevipes]|nr:hypothetical protein BC826DRAFT_57309 [Russula brevipes]